MGRFLGEFALLVQIEEKSPEDCVDALIGTNCRTADYEICSLFYFSNRVDAREFFPARFGSRSLDQRLRFSISVPSTSKVSRVSVSLLSFR